MRRSLPNYLHLTEYHLHTQEGENSTETDITNKKTQRTKLEVPHWYGQ